MLVEEWPWGNDDEEGESGASEADPETQRDILLEVSDDECDDLKELSIAVSTRAMEVYHVRRLHPEDSWTVVRGDAVLRSPGKTSQPQAVHLLVVALTISPSNMSLAFSNSSSAMISGISTVVPGRVAKLAVEAEQLAPTIGVAT